MKSKKDFDCLSDQIPIGRGKYIDFLKQRKEVSFTKVLFEMKRTLLISIFHKQIF